MKGSNSKKAANRLQTEHTELQNACNIMQNKTGAPNAASVEESTPESRICMDMLRKPELEQKLSLRNSSRPFMNLTIMIYNVYNFNNFASKQGHFRPWCQEYPSPSLYSRCSLISPEAHDSNPLWAFWRYGMPCHYTVAIYSLIHWCYVNIGK